MKSVWHFCQLPAFEVTDAWCFLFHRSSANVSGSQWWILLCLQSTRSRETLGLMSPHGVWPLQTRGYLSGCNYFLLKQQWLKVCQCINTLYYWQTCMLGQGKCSATESPRSELFSCFEISLCVLTVSATTAVFVQCVLCFRWTYSSEFSQSTQPHWWMGDPMPNITHSQKND